jgi:hypothetical protein
MKAIPTHLILFLAFLTFDLQAYAGFKLPSYVFRFADLEKAKQKAFADGKFVIYLLTEEDSTNDLVEDATMDVIERYKSKGVFVYIPVESNERNELPKEVHSAFASPKAGRYVPRTVVARPNDEVVAIIPYARDEITWTKTLDETDQLLREASQAKQTPPSVEQKATGPVEYLCKVSIADYDPKDPSKQLGTFAAGTKLTVHPDPFPQETRKVVFTQPDGTPIEALCKESDLK